MKYKITLEKFLTSTIKSKMTRSTLPTENPRNFQANLKKAEIQILIDAVKTGQATQKKKTLTDRQRRRAVTPISVVAIGFHSRTSLKTKENKYYTTKFFFLFALSFYFSKLFFFLNFSLQVGFLLIQYSWFLACNFSRVWHGA